MSIYIVLSGTCVLCFSLSMLSILLYVCDEGFVDGTASVVAAVIVWICTHTHASLCFSLLYVALFLYMWCWSWLLQCIYLITFVQVSVVHYMWPSKTKFVISFFFSSSYILIKSEIIFEMELYETTEFHKPFLLFLYMFNRYFLFIVLHLKAIFVPTALSFGMKTSAFVVC